MARYTVFHESQLHSSAETGSLHGLLLDAPYDSIIHDTLDAALPWFDRRMQEIKYEDVPPELKMLKLLLNL